MASLMWVIISSSRRRTLQCLEIFSANQSKATTSDGASLVKRSPSRTNSCQWRRRTGKSAQSSFRVRYIKSRRSVLPHPHPPYKYKPFCPGKLRAACEGTTFFSAFGRPEPNNDDIPENMPPEEDFSTFFGVALFAGSLRRTETRVREGSVVTAS